MKKGRVYLVGAGPGDERLMTLGGLALIKEADVIVYDRLGAEGFLHFAKQDCELIDAGKQPDHHTITQSSINNLLCELAQAGKRVLRLKGGDPFLFGRGGEEALALKKMGIPFEVVPGVSSFYAACSYAGIPITHRALSSSIHVYTGHGRAGTELELDFALMAKQTGTLIFLMAMGNLDYIAKELIANGKDAKTPSAVIEWGTTSKQRELVGSLLNIGQLVKQEGFGNPAVIVIGEVAALSKDIAWQKYRPLWGRKILLAARPETAKEAAEFLSEEGAEVTVWTAAKSSILDNDELKQALKHINKYTWLFFTSAMGVEAFFKAMSDEKMDSRKLSALCIFCIGEKTKKALLEKGLYADYLPREWNAKAAAKELNEFLSSSDTVLFLASQLADNYLEKAVLALGASFHRVDAYSTTIPKSMEEPHLPFNNDFDAIGFFSPSEVDGLFALFDQDFKGARLFPIGSTTRESLIAHGQMTNEECAIPTRLHLAKAILEGLNFGGNDGL